MEFTIRYSLDTLPFKPRGRVVALGLFDGVHKGHLAIIRDAVRKAAAEGLTSCVQTFINIPKSDGGELTTPEERLAILSGLGVDELLVLDYNEVCGMAPGDFVADCLLVRMGAAAVVVGDDYRFGCGASGDVAILKSLCTPLAIDVHVHDALVTDGRKISSTWLRERPHFRPPGQVRRPVQRQVLQLHRQSRYRQADGAPHGLSHRQSRHPRIKDRHPPRSLRVARHPRQAHPLRGHECGAEADTGGHYARRLRDVHIRF